MIPAQRTEELHEILKNCLKAVFDILIRDCHEGDPAKAELNQETIMILSNLSANFLSFIVTRLSTMKELGDFKEEMIKIFFDIFDKAEEKMKTIN